jgi:2-phospho-L-lactate/phosphoenolpyruvate guanylyltransferase
MSAPRDIRAVVPVKAFARAKQRLAGVLPPALRQALARAMLEDVLASLAAVPALGGIIVVTEDEGAARLAQRFGASVTRATAGEGHSEAVTAAARALAREGAALLTLPSDIPLVSPEDIERLIAAHRASPCFAIVPARDGRGSNAILCAPADAVPLRFGEDSFRAHLTAARRCGIAPEIVRLPRIALDIDRPEDLAQFLAMPSQTRARALLERHGMSAPHLQEAGQ